ncbi:MAG: L,D-transpeptidase [Patescibacteria group bacterium]
MHFARPFFFVVFGGTLALTVLQLTLTSFTQGSLPTACAPLSAEGGFDSSQTVAFWNNKQIDVIPSVLVETRSDRTVLGDSSSEKWIEIDLSEQKLTAHQGDSIFLTTLISSGLSNKTPTGEYTIWYKIASTKMEGGNKLNGSYYYLPNVPFSMFFKGDYGIHGTYWHNNFGQPMSHGCVNTPTDMARRIFYWADPKLPEGKLLVRATDANPGTRVVIHD